VSILKALKSLAVLLCLVNRAAADPVRVDIDPAAPAHPFPHVWETMMGSGRAALALRAAYRRDLSLVKAATGLGYVRFHGIFHDELGVYGEDRYGRPAYDFQYVDQIYDGLLASGVRPAVELGFMPRDLALRPDHHPFWYRPIVAPPKSYDKWAALIQAFARHLVERYGIDEVATWYFEVWNEPNLDFWTGDPKQASYFELYDHTARALKAVDARLRVGGPATAQTAWVPAFIAHTQQAHVPVDFVSTHIYGDEDPVLVFGPGHETAARGYDLVCPSIRKVHDEIAASARPDLPLQISEFNATSNSRDPKLASPFMGPWLARTIRDCDGLAEVMSYWTFSDVFEEQGVLTQPFADGFGLVGLGGVPKPVFGAFALLHRLGTERLASAADNVLVTRRADGTLVLAAWNAAPDGAPVRLDLGVPGTAARVFRVDPDHGNAIDLYERMGAPRYPTAPQLAALRAAADPGPPETVTPANGRLTLDLPPYGLAVVEIDPSK
jgi:xylan 1,4-beta-xylosidase